MPLSHFERMMALVDEVFASKNDPDQLDVDEEVLRRLQQLHPSSVGEYDDGKGPVAWLLLVPTHRELMELFLAGNLTEKELFAQTLPGAHYDAIYLCSAVVLEEYRRKGITKQLAIKAIEDIRSEHPIQALFVWAFSKEGDLGAEAIARTTGIPLFKR